MKIEQITWETSFKGESRGAINVKEIFDALVYGRGYVAFKTTYDFLYPSGRTKCSSCILNFLQPALPSGHCGLQSRASPALSKY